MNKVNKQKCKINRMTPNKNFININKPVKAGVKTTIVLTIATNNKIP